MEKSNLWCRVLEAKYGDNIFFNPKGRNNKISPMVKSIEEIKQHEKLKIYEVEDFQWLIGKGKDVLF